MAQQLAGRDSQMAKILANMDDVDDDVTTPDPDIQEDATPVDPLTAEKLKREQIRTEQEIIKLERAKSLAKGQATKDALAEEIRQARIRKEELRVEKEQQTKAWKTAKDVHGIGHAVYSDIKTNVDGTVNKVGKTADDVKQNLESLAVPGSIWLPITVLLVFFFLLLPVNGMTRAQWLFQTLIGNAQIGGSGAATATTDTTTTGGSATGGFGGGGESNGRLRTFTR